MTYPSRCHYSHSGTNRDISLIGQALYRATLAPSIVPDIYKLVEPCFYFSHHLKASCVGHSVCLTLCDPVDCCPPGSSVHGILQARPLEWVVNSPSRGGEGEACVLVRAQEQLKHQTEPLPAGALGHSDPVWTPEHPRGLLPTPQSLWSSKPGGPLQKTLC